MTRKPDPRLQQGRVGRRLGALRRALGRTQQEVADAMDWSLSKVIRIETAVVRISTSDLRALAAEYGASREETEELVAAARASREKPWYARFGTIEEELRQLLVFESVTTAVHQFQFEVFPGLLQTPGYAGGVLSLYRPAEEIEAALELRAERRRHLLPDDGPWPEFHLILDENVLLRPVGGRAALREQLTDLLAVAARPEVTIAVVPLAVGAYPGLDGSFTLMALDDPHQDFAVYVDDQEHYLTNRDEDVARRFWDRWAGIEAVAVTGDDVLPMIEQALDRLSER